MIISATADDAIAVFAQTGSERFRIRHHLLLILAKLWLQCFVKTNRFRCDHVHERATLNAREHQRVDLLGFLSYAVMCNLIKFPGKVCRMPMGEMTAVGEVHR